MGEDCIWKKKEGRRRSEGGKGKDGTEFAFDREHQKHPRAVRYGLRHSSVERSPLCTSPTRGTTHLVSMMNECSKASAQY